VNGESFVVGGVTENFHYVSLLTDIDPLMMSVSETGATSPSRQNLFVRLPLSGGVDDIIKQIERMYNSTVSNQPFQFYFLDSALESLYSKEQNAKHLILIASIVSVLLSCIGLFGFCTFIVEQKMREFGIRKCLGATTGQIVLKLLSYFTLIVILAFALSIPISLFLVNGWLETFQHRTQLEITTFVLSAAIMLSIAIVTVIAKALSAARINPIEIVRNAN
jgi:putative ABC transport system permease protein